MDQPPADDPIPTAKVVDRHADRRAVGRAVRRFGCGLLGAIMAMGWVLGASFALALPITRADQKMGIEIWDFAVVAVFGLIGFLLVRRIVRPSILEMKHNRGGTAEYFSTSWVHAVFDLFWLAFGMLGLSDSQGWTGAPTASLSFGVGLGFTIVPGSLFLLRLIFHQRTRDLEAR